MMASGSHTFEEVKPVVLTSHGRTTPREKAEFYSSWAENYDQDVAVIEYRAPTLAANSISKHFSGDREKAVLLDVACGTGLVAKQMKKHGFGRFVGVDGSEGMLKLAGETGLYQELKQTLLGEEPLPVQWAGSFDVVLIIGALSAGLVQVAVVRELYKATKPGGYVCMTARCDSGNLEYKGALSQELKQMEEVGLWVCVEVTEVKDWVRDVSEKEDGYVPGVVFLYKKL